jgi:hypothetical protein
MIGNRGHVEIELGPSDAKTKAFNVGAAINVEPEIPKECTTETASSGTIHEGWNGNDRAILVQGDEGPAQVVRLGHRWHSID